VESAPIQPVIASDGEVTVLQDGRVLITGGLIWDSKYVSSSNLGQRSQYSQIYDPVTKSFAAPVLMKRERYRHQAVLLPDGRVLVAGGSCDSCFSVFPNTRDIAKAEIFDPASGSWSWAGEMVHPREKFAMVVLDGRVYAIGGGIWGDVNDPLDPNGYLSSVEVYDPVTDQWQVSNQRLPEGVYSPIVVPLDAQRVLIAGGFVEDPVDGGSRESASTGVFTARTSGDQFKSGGSLHTPRVLASGTLLTDGRVIVVGGNHQGNQLDSSEIYNPSTQTWSRVLSLLPQGRSGASLLNVGGRITLYGGDSGAYALLAGPSPLDEVLTFDEQTETWALSGARLLTPRAYLKVVPVLQGQKAFVFGGLDSTTVSASNLFEIQ
jgi:hypothetical protein